MNLNFDLAAQKVNHPLIPKLPICNRAMTGSLKRHPSEEPDESPKAKRRESPSTAEPSTALTEASTEGSPTTDAKEDTAPAPPSFLSPPTKIGGVSITEKVGISADKGKLNGNGTSILSSGFSLATSTSLFSPSNGKKKWPGFFFQSIYALDYPYPATLLVLLIPRAFLGRPFHCNRTTLFFKFSIVGFVPRNRRKTRQFSELQISVLPLLVSHYWLLSTIVLPGSSFGSSSNGTNIFAAALSNVGTGGGIFGAASKSSSSGLNTSFSYLYRNFELQCSDYSI